VDSAAGSAQVQHGGPRSRLEYEALLTDAARFDDLERDDPELAFRIAAPSQDDAYYHCRDTTPIVERCSFVVEAVLEPGHPATVGYARLAEAPVGTDSPSADCRAYAACYVRGFATRALSLDHAGPLAIRRSLTAAPPHPPFWDDADAIRAVIHLMEEDFAATMDRPRDFQRMMAEDALARYRRRIFELEGSWP